MTILIKKMRTFKACSIDPKRSSLTQISNIKGMALLKNFRMASGRYKADIATIGSTTAVGPARSFSIGKSQPTRNIKLS